MDYARNETPLPASSRLSDLHEPRYMTYAFTSPADAHRFLGRVTGHNIFARMDVVSDLKVEILYVRDSDLLQADDLADED